MISMQDATATDTATDVTAAADRTIGVTVDVKACLAAAGAPTADVGTLLTVMAMGAEQPGGANITGMDVEVRLP